MRPAFCLLMIAFAAGAAANDFPTFERVDYVIACMKQNGGQNVDNMFACSCALDKIAGQMNFDDFNEATTFERYKRMPGEKGGLFRDSERGDELADRLGAARNEAAKACFVGRTAELTW